VFHGCGQHVRVGLTAHVQNGHAKWPCHRAHEPVSLAAQLTAHRPALVSRAQCATPGIWNAVR
jgi:hypothetical protein